jgi:nucleoside-diphosphate-sugar epimerase
MRILITAGSGLTGNAFQKLAADKYSNHEFILHTKSKGDLAEPSVFKFLQRSHNPDVIIHNAGKLHGSFADKESIEESEQVNNKIFENLLRIVEPHQQVYCLSSYHVFRSSAPYNFLDLESLNRETSYAQGKSSQIERVRLNSNIKFIILPHLFGEYDNFSRGRAHFVANSIRRVVEAQQRRDLQIDFFGSIHKKLQFATADLAADFTLNTILSDRAFLERYFLANIGWVRNCHEVFRRICNIVGFSGLVKPINSDSDNLGSDMYFPISANPHDSDEQNFLASLLTTVEFFKEGESNYVN